ncbi:MAG: oligosaccharide flippase family protein [Candidatus Ratteibacteria bacterium]|nr:oligosaccharide flippase family protein [Candidatus Ratteibacteria bacterium]
MKYFTVKIITSLYEKIFHKKISHEVKNFLKNLSYVSIGAIIASIFSFIFNILAGRFLGPSEYGNFAIVQSVAMFLYIPMLLGFSMAMTKYSSENKDFKIQSKIISTTYSLVACLTIASIILYLTLSPYLSTVFRIPRNTFYLSVIFAVLFTLYTLTTTTLQGLFKMKILAFSQPAFTVILLGVFLLFIFGNKISFKYAVYSMYVSYGVVSLVLLVFFLRSYIRFEFDEPWRTILTKYSMLAVIGGLSFVFYTNIDMILINKYMKTADVGIYKAYSLGSINLARSLFLILNMVFFPTASRFKNKKEILKMINKFMPYLMGWGILFIFFCEFMILKFYGTSYSFKVGLSFFFAVAAIIVFAAECYIWLMASVGKKGIKITAFSDVTCGITSVGLNFLLIPILGILGAVISIGVAHLASLSIVIFNRYLLHLEEQD